MAASLRHRHFPFGVLAVLVAFAAVASGTTVQATATRHGPRQWTRRARRTGRDDGSFPIQARRDERIAAIRGILNADQVIQFDANVAENEEQKLQHLGTRMTPMTRIVAD